MSEEAACAAVNQLPQRSEFPYGVEPRSSFFFDRTDVIPYFVSIKNVVFFRPPGFGKSEWLNTLRYFFERPDECLKLKVTKTSFSTLAADGTRVVWRPGAPEHYFPPCPVILIDLSSFKPRNKLEYSQMLGDVLLKSYTGAMNVSPTPGFDTLRDYRLEQKEHSLHMVFVLIQDLSLRSKWGKVVVLVDGYDSCLISRGQEAESDVQYRPDEVVRMHMELFSLLNALESMIVMQCVCGVSRHLMADVLVPENHLKDISLEPEIATLFGFTPCEAELIAKFHRLPDAFIEGMEAQFGGYCFNPRNTMVTVYNPRKFLDSVESRHLFHRMDSTSQPVYDCPDQIVAWEPSLPFRISLSDAQSPGTIWKRYSPESLLKNAAARLLFHSGHVTIKSISVPRGETMLELDYPNEFVRREVFCMLLHHLQDDFSTQKPPMEHYWTLANQHCGKIISSLRSRPTPDWLGVIKHINSFESCIEGRIDEHEPEFERELLALLHMPRVDLISTRTSLEQGRLAVSYVLRNKDGTCDSRFDFELKTREFAVDSIDPLDPMSDPYDRFAHPIDRFVDTASKANRQMVETGMDVYDKEYVLGPKLDPNINPHFQYTCGLVVSTRAKKVMAVSLGSGVVLTASQNGDSYDVMYLGADHYATELCAQSFSGPLFERLFKKTRMSPFCLIEPSRLLKDFNGHGFCEDEIASMAYSASHIMPSPVVLCQGRTPAQLIEHLVTREKQRQVLRRHLRARLSTGEISKLDLATGIAVNRLDLLIDTHRDRQRTLAMQAGDHEIESLQSAKFARSSLSEPTTANSELSTRASEPAIGKVLPPASTAVRLCSLNPTSAFLFQGGNEATHALKRERQF